MSWGLQEPYPDEMLQAKFTQIMEFKRFQCVMLATFVLEYFFWLVDVQAVGRAATGARLCATKNLWVDLAKTLEIARTKQRMTTCRNALDCSHVCHQAGLPSSLSFFYRVM